MSFKKHDWMIHKNLFASTNQHYTISFTWENSKIFNITLKYFNIFNSKPPASWVAHMTRDFLTCYSCSYYSSMLTINDFFWTDFLLGLFTFPYFIDDFFVFFLFICLYVRRFYFVLWVHFMSALLKLYIF